MTEIKECIMTVVGKKILEDELENLIKNEREQIKTAISEARAQGDLKENADYAAAKERQSIIEGRVLELQSKLSRAKVIDPKTVKSNKIVFGATVTIFDVKKDDSITYQIVGEDEADIKKNKISYTSPLGKSLIGLEEGDTATVRAPKGNIEYDIETVRYI